MNALAVYMGKSIVPISRIVGIFTRGWTAELGSWLPLIQAIAVILVEWLILYWMYKRRIFLRA
jgi:predicted acyltransferase